jgi:hypothetical protein
VIPRRPIDVWRADPGAFSGLPTRADVASGYLDGNREYQADLIDCSWDEAGEALEVEIARLGAAAGAKTAEEFDDLVDGDLEDWEQIAVCGLDVGVAAAVMALNAAGCVTSTSCRGHPGLATRERDYPQIRVFADRARGALVAEAVAAAGCGLDLDNEGVGLLWAPSVQETIALAGQLISMRPRFDLVGPRAFR